MVGFGVLDKKSVDLLEDGENDWLLLDDINSICWCIKSIGGSVPDDGIVDPAQCVNGRVCYQE